ncbi:MAG: DUF6318 family protein [Actinomyces sp.]|nr:DUF6318 family protein [Actinomyces sp.]
MEEYNAMTVPPLFDHLDTEDEDQLRHDAAPRDALFEAGSGPGVGDDNPPAGAHPRLWAWLHVEPFYWTMRVVYVCLAAGAVFAVYINGVAEGWWHAWGEKPSVAATTPATQPAPTASPSASGEAAMSGGYQIGPDGILVRPAQYAADTYTKPELPEEAKENTERGAEAAAEHFHALMGYTWNTGDVQPIQDFSDPSSQFVSSYVQDVSDLYASGWAYGSESQIMHVLKVEPIAANGADIPPNTVTVAFRLKSTDGTTCRGQKIRVKDEEYESTLILLMTWKGDRWIETQATIRTGNEQ